MKLGVPLGSRGPEGKKTGGMAPLFSGHLVDHWSVQWSWNWTSLRPGSSKPGILGLKDFFQSLLWGFPKCGAGPQIGNISNVAVILLAEENIDV